MSPTHVELVGLPGAGKTSVVKNLTESYIPNSHQLRIGYKVAVCRSIFTQHVDTISQILPVELVEALSQTSKVTHPERHRQRHRDFIQFINKIVLEYTDSSDRISTVREWIIDLVIQYSTTMELLSSDEVVLCDEGFLQRGIATFCPPEPLKQVDPAEIRSHLSRVAEPDIVVVLDVPTDVAISRIKNRPEGPPDSFANNIKNRFNRIRSVIDEMVTCLEEMNIEYMRIMNDEGVGNACHNIVDQIS